MNRLNYKYKLLSIGFLAGLLALSIQSVIPEAKSLSQEESLEATSSMEETTTVEEVTTIVEEATTIVEEVTTESLISATVNTKPEQVAQPIKEYSYYKVIDTNENNYESTLDLELQDYLYETCKKYDIEDHYELLMAQMYNESRFKSDTISETDDWGLMQINECNHEWLSDKLGVTNFLDPYQSIECGVYMMSGYLKKYSEETALVAYNRGESSVKQGRTSSKYSARVLGYKDMLVEISEDN